MTATNPNVNAVQWFSDNIFGDLHAAAGDGVRPALQVYIIRDLYIFRHQLGFFGARGYLCLYLPRQLTKEQVVSVISLIAATKPPGVAESRVVCCGSARSLQFLSSVCVPEVPRRSSTPASSLPSPHPHRQISAGSHPRTCNPPRQGRRPEHPGESAEINFSFSYVRSTDTVIHRRSPRRKE